MAPFGLTEPLFVPEYWNPPSLFELAQKTGFDIESIIFSFAIGGIGAVLYNILVRRRLVPLRPEERHHSRHRWHRWALATPFALFPILYFLPWNVIYAGIAAMTAGAIAAVLCRPELKTNTLRSLIPRALYDFSARLEMVGAGLHRTSLEPQGSKWNRDLWFADRGTVVWICIRSCLDGDI